MAANSNFTIKLNLETASNMSEIVKQTETLAKDMSKLSLPTDLQGKAKKIFGEMEASILKASDQLKKGFKNQKELNSFDKEIDNITKGFNSLGQMMNKLSGDKKIDLAKIIPPGMSPELDKIRGELKGLEDRLKALKSVDLSGQMNGLKSALEGLSSVSQKESGYMKTLNEALASGSTDIKTYQSALSGANKALAYYDKEIERSGSLSAEAQQRYEAIQAVIRNLNQVLGTLGQGGELERVQQEIKNLQGQELEAAASAARSYGDSLYQAGDGARAFGEEEKRAGQETVNMSNQMNQLKSRMEQFFGVVNIISLFRRAVTQAFNTVKDLDAAMTEMAVVTDQSIGDYWAQLPEYTKRAKELGVAIGDVYKADTLYYQQGLKTEQVLAVSNETMKMAKIAGLETAEATDRMTNALRGFNMEITEANAQNVNDVYSNLAANTASNVDEISTAMTKVASLSSSVNMSFENTAAFLSQIIETTRESAETAGTALKTIEARFAEMKSNPAGIVDVEGEEVAYNKVDAALRTVGISLKDFMNGTEGLDSVLLRLAERWDSLDVPTQRYIATMAAGSRQQSRFIALMSDYDRTVELTTLAQNSAGASTEQFNDTLESLQTAINRLEAAWQQFTMAIANVGIIEFLINALTTLLDVGNKIVETAQNIGGIFGETGSSIAGSAAAIGLFIGVLKIGAAVWKAFAAQQAKSKVLTFQNAAGEKIELAVQKKSNTEKSKANILQRTENLLKKQKEKNLNSLLPFLGLENTLRQQGITTGQKEIVATAKRLGLTEAEAAAIIKESGATSVDTALLALHTAAMDEDNKVQKKGILLSLAEAAAATLVAVGKTAMIAIFGVEGMTRKEAIKNLWKETAATWSNVGASIAEKTAKLQNIVVTKLETAAKNGSTVAQWAYNIATSYWVALIVIALALIILLVAALAIFIGNQDDGTKAINQSDEALQQLNEELADAKQKYKELNEKLDELKDKQEALKGMTEGTEEWNEAVQEINSSVLDLIDEYGDLAEAVTFENGVAQIDYDSKAYKDFQKQQKEHVSDLQYMQIGEMQRNQRLKTEKAMTDLVYGRTEGDTWAEKGKETTKELMELDAKQRATNSAMASAIVSNTGFKGERRKEATKFLQGINFDERSQEYAIKKQTEMDQANMLQQGKNMAIGYALGGPLGAVGARIFGGSYHDMTYNQTLEQYGKMRYGDDFEGVSGNKIKHKNAEGKTEETEVTYEQARDEMATTEYAKLVEDQMKQLSFNLDQNLDKITDNGSGITEEYKNYIIKEREKVGNSLDKLNLSLEKDFKGSYEKAAAFTRAYDQFLNQFPGVGEKVDDIVSSYMDSDSKEELMELFSGTNWDSAIDGAAALKKAMEEGSESVRDCAGELVSIDEISQRYNTTAQAGEVYTQLGSKALEGLKENGEYSAKKIRELAKNTDYLNTMLDTTEISTQTLADYFQLLDDGVLVSTNNMSDFVKVLDKTCKSANLLSDALGSVEDLQASVSTSTADVGDKYSEVQESFKKLYDQGLYSSDAIIDYEKFIFGDNYDAILDKYGNDMEKVATEAFKRIKTLDTKSFYSSWAAGADASDGLWSIGSDGSIVLNEDQLDKVGVDGLINKYAEVMGVSKEIAEAAVAELQDSSAYIRQYLGSLSLEDGLKEWLKSSTFQMDGTTYANEAELKILAEKTGMDLEALKEIIAKQTGVVVTKIVEDTGQLTETGKELFQKDFDSMSELATSAINGTLTEEQKKSGLGKAVEGLEEITDEEQKKTKVNQLMLQAMIKDARDTGLSDEAIKEFLRDQEYFSEDQEDFDENFEAALKELDLKDALMSDKEQSMAVATGASIAMSKVLPKVFQAYGVGNKDKEQVVDLDSDFFDGLSNAFDDVLTTNTETGSGFGTEGEVNVNNLDLTEEIKEEMKNSGKDLAAYITQLAKDPTQDSAGKEWTNPYDYLYNLNNQIDQTLRVREKLERKYNKILQDENHTIFDLMEVRKEQAEQDAALLQNYRTKYASIRRDLDEIDSEKYEGKSFSEYGITKYAKYDEEKQIVVIDYDSIERDRYNGAITEYEGKALEEYVKKLEEYKGSLDDISDQIDEVIDKQEEARKESMSNASEILNTIRDALVNKYQSQIDQFQSFSDTWKESNDEILENLQASIELQRQIRENTEKEEALSEEEAKLAYLQRDTSDANAEEILKLQEQLEDDRQSYADSLVDQSISQLQEANEKAASQREKQITLMSNQLALAQATGKLWEDVDILLKNSIGPDGKITSGSALYNLLAGDGGFLQINKIDEKLWTENFQESIKTAIQGLGDYEVSQFKEKGSVKVDGKVYDYKEVIDTDGSKKMGWVSRNSHDQGKYDFYDADSLNYNYLTGETSFAQTAQNGYYGEDKQWHIGTKPIIVYSPPGSTNSELNELRLEQFDKRDKRKSEIVKSASSDDMLKIKEKRNELIIIEEKIKQFENEETHQEPEYLTSLEKKKEDLQNEILDLRKKMAGIVSYKTGGLIDYTGPAWLDGTRSRPELVLNQQDTQNFLQLKDILSKVMGTDITNTTTTSNSQFDINIIVDQIGSDYDVDQLYNKIVDKMYEQGSYRNVTMARN